MASNNNFFGFSLKRDEQDDGSKNSSRIQDYINKYKVHSRDLQNEKKKEKGSDTYWQGYSWLEEATATSNERKNRYTEYAEMTKVPELNQGLHIYADNATQYNIQNNVLEIESENSKIIEILNALFFENLDVNANLWAITKNMCKFGDEFMEVIPDNKKNPHHVISLERVKRPEFIKRIEKKGQLQKFLYAHEKEEEVEEKTFQPWQMVHFRIADDEFDPYGRSIFESGRRTWKRLSLMEDAMLVYRISRAPERRVFYVDVGTLSTRDANDYLEQLKRKFKKKSYVNPKTGEVDEKANPLAVDEDFFIAVRQESQGTRIETLPAGQNLGEIDDVKYFKDMILKTLGIPSGYLGGTESAGTFDSKSFLSQQDIQFSRTIERIQKFIVRGLEKVAIIELIFNKIEEDELNNFKIKLTAPSNVDQLMEIDIRNQQFGLISTIKTAGGEQPILPDEWIYKNVLGMSEREINQVKLQLQMQLQMQAQMQAMYGEGAAMGGDMGGGGGGNIVPPMAGGPAGMEGGETPEPGAGGLEPLGAGGEGETPPGGAGLEVAGKSFVEFDGGNWLMENAQDIQNLLKYMKLYEKVHKDKHEKVYEQKNSVTRMAIKGEFRGILTANNCSNGNITLVEDKKFRKQTTIKKEKHEHLEESK